MKTPALAVMGPDRQIVRSTEGFRHYENAEKICRNSPELECVLTGYADAATIKFGELSIKVEAITDASGRRQAKLTLPPVAAPVKNDLDVAREPSGPRLELDRRHVSAATPSISDETEPEATVQEVPVSRPTEVAATPPAPSPTLSETAELLQRNLELARKWAELGASLQDKLRQSQAAAARAAEEANRWRNELEESRTELAAARAEAEALRGRSAEALRRSDELGETLDRLRSWLGDFESALEPKLAATPA